MQHDPEEFMRGARDSLRERTVHKWLRAQRDSNRLAFVMACLEFPTRDGRAYQLALSTIARPDDALAVLRRHLDRPDPSGIKWWLDFGFRKIGGLRVIREVASYIDHQPDTVSMAVYWLPRLIESSGSRVRHELDVLIAEAKQRGIIRGSQTLVTEGGKTLFMNVFAQTKADEKAAEPGATDNPDGAQ